MLISSAFNYSSIKYYIFIKLSINSCKYSLFIISSYYGYNCNYMPNKLGIGSRSLPNKLGIGSRSLPNKLGICVIELGINRGHAFPD